MSIASKEARETNYWLRLLRDSKILDEADAKSLLSESDAIIKILTSIVKSTNESNSKPINSKFKISFAELTSTTQLVYYAKHKSTIIDTQKRAK
jgi:hypothetical protein